MTTPELLSPVEPVPTTIKTTDERISNKPNALAYRMPPITLLSLLMELGLLLAITLIATWSTGHASDASELRGGEMEWLTSSAYMSSQSLHQLGYIPHWEPWLAFGEPLVDNPFSFVTNPISIGPSLIWGALIGIRVSVVLCAILAAFGGWTLGRVLGFGWLARLLLGLLCLGKGNMLAMIGTGYFQLGVTQAYFPWILAGFIGVLRFNRRRWPVVLTAVMVTLMFWAGNIWYTLPMVIILGLLTVSHVVKVKRTAAPDEGPPITIKIDRPILNRVILSAVLTIGLAMITLLPIWINQSRIGGHPNESIGNTTADLGKVLYQFINGDDAPEMAPGLDQFYYSFILPLWFGVLLFILLPPIKMLWKARMPGGWRIWAVIVFIIIFCIAWGVGGNPFFVFLYNNVPLIGQWRFVGRALAVASFGIAVLTAARVDGLLGALTWKSTTVKADASKQLTQMGPSVRWLLSVVVMIASIVAAWQVDSRWPVMVNTFDTTRQGDGVCLDWLRQQNPGHQLAVYAQDYYAVYAFLRNNIRTSYISADFHPVPDDGTLYHPILIKSLPEYGIAWIPSIRAFFTENGYSNLMDSPAPVDTFHCLWRKPDALQYAFTIPLPTLTVLDQNNITLTLADTIPLADNTIIRTPDEVGLYVTGDANQALVATIQELAYPGWAVQVDGVNTKLESIGGQLGVVIPPGVKSHTVDFYFQPVTLYRGAIVTLFSVLFCILYLLNAERLIPPAVRNQIYERSTGLIHQTRLRLVRLGTVLMNPELFEPQDMVKEPSDSIGSKSVDKTTSDPVTDSNNEAKTG